jgi:hypothetical protein
MTTIITEYEGEIISTNSIIKCDTLLITTILTNYSSQIKIIALSNEI